MATEAPVQNGHTESNGTSELTPAQKLMQKHEGHKVELEEVPDEDDLRHTATPESASILEAANGGEETPGWVPPPSAKAAGKQPAKENKPLDLQNNILFPELGGGPKSQAPKIAPTWSAKKPAVSSANGASSNGVSTPASGTATPNSAVRDGPAVVSIPGRHTERIVLEPHDILQRAQLKRPISDVLKDINRKSKAQVSMTAANGGKTVFTATGPKEAGRQALKDVIQQIGVKHTTTVHVPRSVRAQIIGKQGATIKHIQEKTGARIQMPKNEDVPSSKDDDDDDATIEVKIEGNTVAANWARQEILKIADERTSTLNQRLRDIPAEFYPFIAGANNSRIGELEQGGDVKVHVPAYHTWKRQAPPQAAPGQQPNFLPAADGNYITLQGDRAAVQQARAEIERQVQELRQKLVLQQHAIEKGRHQFVIGERGVPIHEFFAETGCAVILPSGGDDEVITIVGPAELVDAGADKVMDLATSMNLTNIDIARQHANDARHARDLTRYLQQRREIQRLEKAYDAHINVDPILQGGPAPWELYSRDGKNGLRARTEITNIVNGHPPSRMANVDVDPFFYQHLRSAATPKLRQDYGVQLIIPNESDPASSVLLVFEGPSGASSDYQVPRTQPTQAEIKAFQQGLNDARKHILELISQQSELSQRDLEVPLKFHEKLRRFVKGEQAKLPEGEIPVRIEASGTTVSLRGPTSSVDSLAEKMTAWVEQEKEDEKERGFTLSFDFPQKHANQLIGKQGARIKELREKFDVDIQVNDGKVELKGPKAKAEAAKAHITSLGRAWADEVSYVLKVEPKYHRELIGAQGNQIKKLESRYAVDIHFPRTAKPAKDEQTEADDASDAGRKAGRQQAEDEVSVRGPKRGADEARDEILSLLQYLKDNSNTATVVVQQSQIPSLMGQRGSEMEALRQTTGARIDVPNARDIKDPSGNVEIQIRGTKTQVAQAKKLIEEKKAVFDKTVTKTIEIDRKHHSALIGSQGSNLRDIIIKAGGSAEGRDQTRTVQFPRSGAEGNTIKVEGTQEVVDKIIAAMQEIASQRDSQVTEKIDVPSSKHRSLIGRGGDNKRSLETKFNVSIDVPRQGSSSTDVKVTGQPADVEKAVAHIAEITKEQPGVTIQVPKNIHHTISDNGQFFRKLRNNHQVTVEHAGAEIPPKSSAPSNTRANGGSLPLITDDQEAAADSHSWNVISSTATGPEFEGEIPWVLRGSSENIEKARAQLMTAIEQASKHDTTGYLVLPDPRTYRYVIGQGGSKVNSIRKQTGCKVQVPRDQAGEAIEVSGSAEGVEKAKDLILEAVREGSSNANRS